MDQMMCNNQDNGPRKKAADEKFCGSCGEIIKIQAEICPKCGVRQKGQPLSKAALLLFTFFLGGLGAHKFYTGRNWQGFFYLLFCWTGIPGLLSLIEFIIYAFTGSEKLQEKYPCSGGTVVVAVIVGGIGFIFTVGILAAIAIPQFVTYRNRAHQAAVRSELHNVLIAEQAYFVEHNTYSTNIGVLNLPPGIPEVTVEITSADENCFEAAGRYGTLQEIIFVDCNGLK